MKKIDRNTTRDMLAIYKQEIKADKRSVIFFSIVIPFGHLLRFVALPLLISFIIQSLITQPDNISHPLQLVGLTAFVMIVSTILNDIGYTALFNHEERAHTKLLELGTRRLLAHSYTFFAGQKTGTLSGDLMNFGKSYVQLLDIYFLQTNHLIVSFVVSILVISFLAPALLLPTALIMATIILLNIRSVKQRSPHRNKRKILTSQLSGTISDILGNQQLVRMFAKEKLEATRILSERLQIEKVVQKEIEIIERESLYRQLTLYTFQIIVLLLFIWLFSRNSISIAGLLFTFTYLSRSTDAIFGISGLIRNYEQAILDAAPMTKILQQEPQVTDRPDAVDITVTKGEIRFQDVDFNYHGTDTDSDGVFKSFNLHIPAGQRIGLAGRSGGGKTTLTKLLLRFLDIDSGTITIDNQDIKSVTQESLRSAISYVPQDPFLFHRNLRDNIAYGTVDATDEAILDACKKAYIYDFILSLPEGLDTMVGERGVKLSGGQRQRIAIARAVLRDAPIIVLDEATSALDSESEHYIQKALNELMKNKTCVVIAHRLSTISKLDRIVVLDEGRILEDGTHAELLTNKGVYAKLWSHQSGGFIED